MVACFSVMFILKITPRVFRSFTRFADVPPRLRGECDSCFEQSPAVRGLGSVVFRGWGAGERSRGRWAGGGFAEEGKDRDGTEGRWGTGGGLSRARSLGVLMVGFWLLGDPLLWPLCF